MRYFVQTIIKSAPILLAVLALHLLLFWQVMQLAPAKQASRAPKAITVSLITLPPKQTVQPKAPKKVVKRTVRKYKKPQKKLVIKKRYKPRYKPVIKKPKPVKRVVTQRKVTTSSKRKVVTQPQKTSQKVAKAPTKRATKRIVTIPPSYKAAYLHNPPPSYPRFSRRRGEEGTVWLRVKVTQTGKAALVKLKKSSGFSRLDKAAHQAVSQWRFIPAKKAGQLIAAWVTVPVVFKLR